jgi:glycosyltransferase involved in cell wall biosynthesis
MSELVSIIIPVYNSAQFLKDSIESVLNQTYSNIEIICINDGSTDNSLEILQSFSDRIYIVSQDNKGLASALNVGIKEMQGKWFKWFSPDDIMYPNTIESLVKTAKKYPDRIIYSNWEMIDESGNKLQEFYESNYNELSTFEYNIRLLDGQQINVNTSLIPSNLLEKCHIRKLEEPVAIDYDFFLHSALLHNTKFYLIPQSLIKYRIHTKQLSHKNISQILDYISELKYKILMKIDESSRNQYEIRFIQYQKNKPKKRKILEFGMKLLSFTPSWVSDKFFIYYLNHVRHSR